MFARITRDWPGVPQMTTAELARRLGEKGGRPVLIDTRKREEYAVSHLPGAVWAETPAPIRAALRDVPPERAMALDCSVGVRSTFDRAAWRFAGLTLELFLLLPNPAKPGDGVGAGDIQTRRTRGGQGDAPIRRMNGEVDVFDVLRRHPDRKLPNLDGLGPQ